MRVLITGASGFIGTALSEALRSRGDEVVSLRRGTDGSGPSWSVAERHIDDDALDGIDAVVHLAAEPILPPFTKGRRKRILESRTVGTGLIARAVARAGTPVFVSASAMGFYGDRGEDVLDETAPKGTGFLSDVVAAWEEATAPASDAGARVVHLRTSLVLDEAGRLLRIVMLPFKLFVGGPLGSGRQFWSFISLEDTIRAILHCLDTESISGPVNVATPHPVRNKEFMRALGAVMGRPSIVQVPAFAMRAVLGSDAVDDLVMASARLSPDVLTSTGFEFHHPTIDEALAAGIG